MGRRKAGGYNTISKWQMRFAAASYSPEESQQLITGLKDPNNCIWNLAFNKLVFGAQSFQIDAGD